MSHPGPCNVILVVKEFVNVSNARGAERGGKPTLLRRNSVAFLSPDRIWRTAVRASSQVDILVWDGMPHPPDDVVALAVPAIHPGGAAIFDCI